MMFYDNSCQMMKAMDLITCHEMSSVSETLQCHRLSWLLILPSPSRHPHMDFDNFWSEGSLFPRDISRIQRTFKKNQGPDFPKCLRYVRQLHPRDLRFSLPQEVKSALHLTSLNEQAIDGASREEGAWRQVAAGGGGG